ncbi:MAG: hypothetical protein WCR45_10915 [Bacteroidaceae bacterium]
MAKGNFSGINCIKEHLATTYKRCKPATVEKYAGVLYNINSILRENGLETQPRKIGEDEVTFLLEQWGPLEVSTKEWYLHIFNRYLKCFKNEIIDDMQIQLGYDMRPNVDWLSDEESDILMNTRLSPLEDTVIHLELCLGLRVSEVVNLRIEDIHFSDDLTKRFVAILGKGVGVGKWRTVPFHPLREEIFTTWLEHRAEMVQKIRAYNPS